MAFSLDTSDFPYIATFAQAEAHWASKKPWRDQPGTYRALEKRSKKHCMLIRMAPDEYRARLHRTDLVKYTPQGVSVYTGYQSISTDNFVMALLRYAGSTVQSNRGHPVAWEINRAGRDDYYSNGQLVNGNWAIFDLNFNLTNPKPHTRLTLDRVKAKVARAAHGLDDFKDWRRAFEAMSPDHVPDFGWQTRRNPAWRPNTTTRETVLNLLAEKGEAWIRLAATCDDTYITECVYRVNAQVVTVEPRNAFKNLHDYDNWLKLDSKYSWAVRS